MFKTGIKITEKDGIMDPVLARLRSNCANRLIPAAHRKGRIMDIGCGMYPLFLISTEFFEKYAIDRIQQESNRRYFNGQKIRLINHDIEKIKSPPFDSGYFDIITMLAVFEHVEKESLKNLLWEVRRILKDGGLFIMTTPAAWADGLLNLVSRIGIISAVGMQEHKGKYTPSKIFPFLREAGFSKQKIQSGYFEMFMNTWLTAIK